VAKIQDVYELNSKADLGGVKKAISTIKDEGGAIGGLAKQAMAAAKGGILKLTSGIGDLIKKAGKLPFNALKKGFSGIGKAISAAGKGLAVFGLAMEGINRAKEMLTSLFEAMREASPEFGKALDRLSAGFDKAKKTVLSAIAKALIPLIEKLADVMEDPRFQQFIETVATFLANAISKAADFITNKAIPALVQFWQQIQPVVDVLRQALGQALEWITNNVVPLLMQALEWLGQKVGEAAAWFVENWDAIKGAVQAAWNFVAPIFELIYAKIAEFWQKIQPQLKQAWDEISTLFLAAVSKIAEFVRENWDKIKSVIDGAMKVITGILQTAWTIISNAIKVVLAVISGDWKTAWESVKNIAKGVWEGIKGIISGAIDVVKGLLGLLGKALRAPWEGLVGLIQNIMDGAKKVLESGINSVIDFLNGLIRTYNNTLGRIPGAHINELEHVSLAQGGIVSSPIAAIVGDNPRTPEVVAPLENLIPMLQRALGGAGAGGMMNVNINVTVAPGGFATPEEAGRRAGDAFVDAARARGIKI